MFRAKFHIDRFASDLATSTETFEIAGAGCVRVKKVSTFEGTCDISETFVAKSRMPFVVVITTEADGGNAHMDGRTEILVATDKEGHSGATISASMGGNPTQWRNLRLEPAA